MPSWGSKPCISTAARSIPRAHSKYAPSERLDMQITKVRAVPLVRPLDRAQRNSREGRAERRFTPAALETEAGRTGPGDALGGQPLVPGDPPPRPRPVGVGARPA